MYIWEVLGGGNVLVIYGYTYCGIYIYLTSLSWFLYIRATVPVSFVYTLSLNTTNFTYTAIWVLHIYFCCAKWFLYILALTLCQQNLAAVFAAKVLSAEGRGLLRKNQATSYRLIRRAHKDLTAKEDTVTYFWCNELFRPIAPSRHPNYLLPILETNVRSCVSVAFEI